MRIMDRPEFKSKGKLLVSNKEDTVLETAIVMSEKNFGSAIVIDADNRPIGIVTERDLMRKIVAASKNPAETKLSEIMTTDLKVARADDNLIDWMRRMSNERFRRLPIVDENGKLIDMMSQGDFVAYTWPDLMARLTEATRATLGKFYPITLIAFGMVAYITATLLIRLITVVF